MIDYERRDVPGYPGWQADTNGKIYCNDQLVPGRQSYEHDYIFILINGKDVKRATMVCLAFHGPKPPDKDVCAHWDDIKHNDKPSNLRWATRKENAEDRVRNERERIAEAKSMLQNGASMLKTDLFLERTYGHLVASGIMWKIRFS